MLEEHEPFLIDEVKELRGDVALDVGANTGDWSIFLAERFKTVVAYEPHPQAVNQLLKNTDEIDNIVVVPTAVGSYLGSVELNMFQDHSHTSVLPPGDESFEPWRSKSANKILLTKCLTLDSHVDFDTRLVGFVKVDVEGMEVEVLKGAIGLVEKHKPVWLIEVHSNQLGIEIRRMLQGAGYTVKDIPHPNTPELSHGWVIARMI